MFSCESQELSSLLVKKQRMLCLFLDFLLKHLTFVLKYGII
jgi:hypothetical protein